MSDNKINPDSKETHRDETPINPGNEEVPKKTSTNEKLSDNESVSEKPEREIFQNNKTGKDDASKLINEVSEDDKASRGENIPEKTDEEKNNQNIFEEEDTFKKKNEFTGEEKSLSEEKIIDKAPEEKLLPVSKPLINKKPSDTNYQISLINENLLKVLVTSQRGVKIYSSLKENKSLLETQSNEIYFNPKMDFSLQEIEVLISIEEKPSIEDGNLKMPNGDSEISSKEKVVNEKSNYQVNLINENLLKIKILTGNGVRIDSIGRDKRNLSQTQSNKIYLKQKQENDLQEIEITIEIDDEIKELKAVTEDGKIRFIPNPEVVDLIKPPDYSAFFQNDQTLTDDDTIYKNPFDALRKLIRRNLTIGLIAAVILHLAAAGFVYYSLSKKSKEQTSEEPSRLIVLQDLPDPKIKLEDIEDPNKPKIEPPIITEEQEKIMREPKREIIPRDVVKPPIVSRPKREEEEDVKLDSSIEANLQRELDSLRQLRESELADSILAETDTTKSDSASSIYEIPDSLKNDFNENDIGLAMYFPKNWKLTDQREINKNEKEFKGVVLTDTTAEQPGTMTMFIFLDNENKDYNAEDFKTEFVMKDSNLTAFSKEPKTLAGFTEYRFYIFNKLGTEKLSLRASVRKQFFDQYKNEIEAVVRSIRIKKKEDL